MAEVSKHMFESACAHLECRDLLHPWSQSCLAGNLWCFAECVKGSYQFYAYVYALQIAMRGKSMTSEDLKIFAKQYVRSGVLGFIVSSSACTMNCIMRNVLFGKFNYYTFLLLPNTLNGLAIYLEPPGRRSLVVNLFFNLVIEYWIKSLERARYISVTPAKLTLFFMVGSALLFYLMRLEGDKTKRTNILWFFTPEKVKRRTVNNNDVDFKEADNSVCPHIGPCWKHVLKKIPGQGSIITIFWEMAQGTGKLFSAGCAITAARVLLPNMSRPLQALASLRARHLRLALFFGGYIGIYRAVVCLLCQRRGLDSALHALPAGFLAGASFRFNPTLGFSIAAVTGAMKLLSTIMYEKKMITERVPLPELLFCACQGMLYHARYMHPELCPNYIFRLMSSVSNGCTEKIYGKMLEALKLAE